MINEQLKELRKAAGLSPFDMAEKLQMTYQTIWRFESGQQKWTEKKMNAYASVLGFKIENNLKIVKL